MAGKNDFDPEEILGAPGLRELVEVDFRHKRTVKTDVIPDSERRWNLEQIHIAAALMATQEEIAEIAGCSVPTLSRHMKKNPELRDAYDSGQELFKATLRRRMFRIAMSRRSDAGRMCQFLAKNHLGYRDRNDVTLVDGTVPGMTQEIKRRAMAELMGEDPNNPTAALTEGDGTED